MRLEASRIRSIGGIRKTDARWLHVPVPPLMTFCDVKKKVVKRSDSVTRSRRNVRNTKYRHMIPVSSTRKSITL